MTKNKLFDEDSEEEEVNLKTENEYAKKYDRWREKEELHKLEQKYGSKPTGSDVSESDSEEESDEPPEISEEIETQFLKTLSLLKTQDPRIYDPNYKFFNEKIEKEKEKSEEVKKVTFADSDDDDDDPNIFSIEKKAEINEPPSKKLSGKSEEGKLKDYLIGKVDHIEETVEKDLAPLKSLWSDPKLNDGEAFLRDYILNKRYLDNDDAETAEQKVRDDEDLEADERTVEEQGKFERAYNFRFEEPDEEYLKRYPRTMSYVRPKDDRRSRKRAEVRDRKGRERERKMEEIARLKALKLKEIQEKIARIKEVTGNEQLAFEEADIEGDFDPEEHDRRMKAIFDEQFYGDADDEKPVFPDLDEELEIENWEKYEKEYDQDNAKLQDGDGPHCEDEDFNMDADYDPKTAKENLLEELKRSQNKKRRNRKRKSKLAEVLALEKPKFTPQEEKSYAEFMEEYYKMDCEDVVGDLPTRFKYREVVPNDFGLTIEEILLADDKELTQWVPLKKLVKYRPENVEKSEVNTYRQKAADERLKRKILPSLFKDLPEEPEIVVPIEETIKKKKKKKKKKKNKTENEEDIVNENDGHLVNGGTDTKEIENSNNVGEKVKKKKKRNNKNESDESANCQVNIGDGNLVSEEVETEEFRITTDTDEKIKRKRKHIVDQTTSQINGNIENDLKHCIDEEGNTTKTEYAKEECSEAINTDKHIGSIQTKKKKNKNRHSECDSTSVGNVKHDLTIEENKDEVGKVKDNISIQSNETNYTLARKHINNTTKDKKKKKGNAFIVEDVTEATNKASRNAKTDNVHVKKRKASHDDGSAPRKKKNKPNKQWNKSKNKSQDNTDKANPLTKLSDERLKAYGLNPKKYRSFLKYKKF